MEPIGIPIIIILLAFFVICIVIPGVVILILLLVARKGKKMIQTAPEQVHQTVKSVLDKLDDRLPNDPREAARWSSGDELDLESIPTPTRTASAWADEPLPDEHEHTTSHCPACGAPLKGGRNTCEFCGHSS
ncbi:MAG: hypothetical protein HPY85_10830 [Anaerolineae bacterium]|nr:hypothetical protein [Anaerolineae bacterium]